MPVRTWEVVAWVLLVVWMTASRWAVAPDILYEWDSANYALGMQEFDVYHHQPHPPGYPLFLAALRLAARLGGNEVTPFLVVNSILGSAILLLMGWLIRRTAGPLGALALAFAFSVCPPFWCQGASSTAYIAECFCSVACGGLALALVRRRISLLLAALLLGLVLGIRPSGTVGLTPVVLLGALLSRPRLSDWIKAAVGFGAACSVWFFPLIIYGGGWVKYRMASDALFAWQLDIGSVFGGDWSTVPHNGGTLSRYLIDSMNLLWIALAGNAILVVIKRPMVWRTAGLLACWVVPGVAVYTLHHLAKSAYVLTLAPATFLMTLMLYVTGRRGLDAPWRRAFSWANGAILGLYLLLNITAFMTAVPVPLLRHKDARIDVPKKAYLAGDYGRLGLIYRTYPQRQMRELVDKLDPDQDLVVYLFGTHELHRFETYYHPHQWMMATTIGHQWALVNPPNRHFPDTFGDFQITVLYTPKLGSLPNGMTCVSAIYDRLILTRDDMELEIPLDKVPRRVLLVYTCPSCLLVLGPGVKYVQDLHVGTAYYAAEVQLPGLSENLDITQWGSEARQDYCDAVVYERVMLDWFGRRSWGPRTNTLTALP